MWFKQFRVLWSLSPALRVFAGMKWCVPVNQVFTAGRAGDILCPAGKPWHSSGYRENLKVAT